MSEEPRERTRTRLKTPACVSIIALVFLRSFDLPSDSAHHAFLQTKVIKIAVPVLAMLLLLTTAAVSTTPVDRACLRAYFRRDMFLVFCVFVSTTTGCFLAWMAVMAPTEASRRSYAWATVRCFALLAINLYFSLSK